jgi:hypothetical protein
MPTDRGWPPHPISHEWHIDGTLSNLYKFVAFVQIYPEDDLIHRYITYHNGA